jgi:hypothetical protein
VWFRKADKMRANHRSAVISAAGGVYDAPTANSRLSANYARPIAVPAKFADITGSSAAIDRHMQTPGG